MDVHDFNILMVTGGIRGQARGRNDQVHNTGHRIDRYRLSQQRLHHLDGDGGAVLAGHLLG